MIDEAFERERGEKIAGISGDEQLNALSLEWIGRAQELGYSYNFDWLGLPIIQ